MQQILHKIWNLWDEHGAIQSIDRLPRETNTELRTRILNVGKYHEDSTRQGLVNSLSSTFGYDQYNVIERRMYYLTHIPHRSSTFAVTVDNVEQPGVTAADYTTAGSGYIVWKDENEEYTRVVEFVCPPHFSRDSTSRKHNGSRVKITYQYQDGDRIRTHTDMSNEYDENDESYMGWTQESEGSIKVHALNDTAWIDNTDSGMKNADGTPTEKLKAIWREIDMTIPTAWGE